MNTKIIKLDLNRILYDKIIAKQGDTKSRFLLFQLLDGSIAFNLTNRSVRAYMVKPDGKEIFNDLIINNYSLGYCTLELTNQVLAVQGTVKIELMVTEEDRKLTSSVFELEVIKSINSEKSIVSTNEFTALLNGLSSLSEYDNYKNEIAAARDGEVNLLTKVKKIDEQLDTIAKGQSEINLINYLDFNGSDETEKLQNLLDTFEVTKKGITLIFPNNKDITLNNLKIRGFINVKGNGCRISGSSGNFAFVNDETKFLTLNLENLNFNKVGCLKLKKINSNCGISCIVNNVEGIGVNNIGTLFYIREIDFSSFENISAWSYDYVFDINKDIKFMNTQLNFKNIRGFDCRTGFKIANSDKIKIDNMDFMGCGTGLSIGSFTKRMKVNNYHCESFGKIEGDNSGYGILFNNFHEIKQIVFSNCSIFLPKTYSKYGIFYNTINTLPLSIHDIVQVEFINVFVEKEINEFNYTPMLLLGNFKFVGHINSIKSKFYKSTNITCVGEIIDKVTPVSDNLLSINKITSLDELTGATNLTLTSDGYFKKLSNETSSDITCKLSFKPLEIGWYTFNFTGDMGNKNDSITIKQDGDPFSTYYISKCYHLENVNNKLYFYVDSITRNVDIRFTIKPTSYLNINKISLIKGFL